MTYSELVTRFRETLQRVIPDENIVVIPTKGDAQLLDLPGRTGWHFPQREDGVYAGYYPPDSSAAIQHLETLRRKGADYFVFPSSAYWWMDSYADFGRYLIEKCQLVNDDSVCRVFALSERAARKPKKKSRKSHRAAEETTPIVLTAAPQIVRADPFQEDQVREAFTNYIHPRHLPDLLALFDYDFYATQAGAFPSVYDALLHYLDKGYLAGFEPHPLFDSKYYLKMHPEVGKHNPLIHFINNAVSRLIDPNPYFDSEFYYSQDVTLRGQGVNALVHYVTNAATATAHRPNPLFAPTHYLKDCPDFDIKSTDPFAHFLRIGCEQGRCGSNIHQSIVDTLLQRGKTRNDALLRGHWRSGIVLVCGEGVDASETHAIQQLAQTLSSQHLRPLVMLIRRTGLCAEDGAKQPPLVLEDFQVAADVLRPSAKRLLMRSLKVQGPSLVISVGGVFASEAVAEAMPSYLIPSRSMLQSEPAKLGEIVRQARRTIFTDSALFRDTSDAIGECPVHAAHIAEWPAAAVHAAEEIVELARRDEVLPRTEKVSCSQKKLLVPCGDWGLSGVNSALESVAKQLKRHGWNVEILFTRSPQCIIESAGDAAHLPQIPYSYLRIDSPGVEGMWEGLMARLESTAPCIMLMSYEFAANSVAPALGDGVGVVGWLQSDDRDYYEQAYRLGRYCNALVCVSDQIKQRVGELNPALAPRCRVIHNSSISADQIRQEDRQRDKKLRLVYTGRLVQYQKRILDVVPLAEALDRLQIPYEINLIGQFASREKETEELFKRRAVDHLKDGRIVLRGRMPQSQVLQELDQHDFFLLLSDFEGLPLALVEAMARGCVPVVGQMDSGIPEAVTDGENGLVIAGRDYDHWGRRIVDIWHDHKRFEKLSASARERVRQQFTAEHVGQQFARMLDQVLEEIRNGTYQRPPCLNWGDSRSPMGDILPPPSLWRAGSVKPYSVQK